MAAVVRLSIDKDIVNGLNSDNRILHCQIDDEEIKLKSSILSNGDEITQFNTLSTIATAGEASFFLFKLSSKWLVISWIPDDVKVRHKMLYSSSRSHLKTTLGLTHFHEKDYNVSEPEELTHEAYLSSLVKVSSLNVREEALAAEKMSTASEGLAGMSSAMGVVPFTLTLDAIDAVDDFSSGSKHFVSLAVQPGCKIGLTESFSSITPPNITGSVGSSSLTSCVPNDSPSFCVIRCVGKIAGSTEEKFVYVCPEGARVKDKMKASTAKTSVVGELKKLGVVFNGNLEVCENDEVDEAVKPAVDDGGATSKAAELTHKKPMRKGRGKARIKKFQPDA